MGDLDRRLTLELGPHIGLSNAWPMSLLIQAQTSDDDEEIMGCLDFVLKSAKLGLIHESIDVNSLGSYTRKWTSAPHASLIKLTLLQEAGSHGPTVCSPRLFLI